MIGCKYELSVSRLYLTRPAESLSESRSLNRVIAKKVTARNRSEYKRFRSPNFQVRVPTSKKNVERPTFGVISSLVFLITQELLPTRIAAVICTSREESSLFPDMVQRRKRREGEVGP